MTFVKAYQAWEYEQKHFTNKDYEIDKPLIIASTSFVGTMQLISFIFLGVGTCIIRKYVVQTTNSRKEINTKILMYHVLSLVFYITTGLFYYIAELIYTISESSDASKRVKGVLIALSINQISSFLAQLF